MSKLAFLSTKKWGLPARLTGIALLFIADKMFLGHFVDFDRAQTAQGIGAIVRGTQHWGFRFLVALAAAVVLFAYTRDDNQLHSATAVIRISKFRAEWLIAHLLLIACLVAPSYWLYRPELSFLPFGAIALLSVLLGTAAAACAILAIAPWRRWLGLMHAIGTLWVYATLAALFAATAMQWSQRFWNATGSVTFRLVHLTLIPLLPTLNADFATRIVRTDRFAVQISDVCSGLEGMGLILAFTVTWLIYFRREYIFPRGLLLLPVGLALIFALNTLRISTLILIGNAGYPDVAVYGFHSQAGWIAFNAVACALVFFSRRSHWLNRTALTVTEPAETYNPTATYLIPLLLILAAGTVSHALSGRFETLYPLRLIAAMTALYALRRPLGEIQWQFTWRGPLVGLCVFLLWMAAAQVLLHESSEPAALAAMSSLPRDMWIASRCLSAIIFVPIAEELAYRGYLMRRLGHSEFESLPFTEVRWPAWIITSIVFGAAHGALWLPGIVAGMAYSMLVIRRGFLGEAVAAHATTNALIAVTVLWGNQWQLW